MYALRIIQTFAEGETQETNILLGNSYTITERKKSPEIFFGEYRTSLEGKDRPIPNNLGEVPVVVVAIILDSFGKYQYLYGDHTYYVMTESGQTFSKLTHLQN